MSSRTNYPNVLSLKPNTPGRRAGLTKAGYSGPQLLQFIRKSESGIRKTMPSNKPLTTSSKGGKKVVEEVKDDTDEGINAAPKSYCSDSSDGQSTDIRRTNFTKSSQEPTSKPSSRKPESKRSIIAKAGSRTSNRKIIPPKNGSTVNSSSRFPPSSSNSSLSDSSKRKSEDSFSELGRGMADEFGNFPKKKARLIQYSSSQNRSGSSQPPKTYTKSTKLEKKAPLREGLKSPQILDFSDDDDSDSDRGFIKQSPVKSASGSAPGSAVKSFQKPPGRTPTKRGNRDEEKLETFKPIYDSDDDLQSPIQRQTFRALSPTSPATEPSATQIHSFKKIDLEGLDDDEIWDKARKILSQTSPNSQRHNSQQRNIPYKEEFPTNTQLARCPMCNQPVDLHELRSQGAMNMRQQAKFCSAHQKKTALEKWQDEAYPEIDWENLDSRIAKHHSFIRDLINGKDSHYRKILEDNVKAGKDRTLLKMTSNLTPGYYGSRGLREISESIMQHFTPLLKKRTATDRLMSARGFTGFVQSVLVPEVTVMLIMEDMTGVDVDKAREILIESAAMGELVHDEIKDTVVLRVEDSDDD